MTDTPFDKNMFINDVREKVYAQDYTSKTKIDGVQIISLTSYPSDEGDFGEIMRFTENGALEQIPEFKLAQINRTRVFPGAIKAWHMHTRQDEIWYVSPYFHIFAGLWDVRENSPTANKTMRLNLGGGRSQLLYIPKGVAHGMANFSPRDAELFYFVTQKFDLQSPDELRVHWDALGADFWKPERD